MSDLDRFVGFCRRFLTTEKGRPLVIEEFQRQILADFFDGSRETVVVIGKKNGKSSLLAALGIYHLLTIPRGGDRRRQPRSGRDHAAPGSGLHPPLRRAEAAAQGSPARDPRRALGRSHPRLASDSDTLDGQIPTLALVDELARTKTEEAYGLLRDGLGPRNGQLVAISTAGDDEESPLGRLRAAAHDMPDFTRDGAHKHARRGGFAWHEWSLEPGDDINDLALLKSCNPASWIDEADLRARRDSPST
jgi:phage terminase large subunit-like protein